MSPQGTKTPVFGTTRWVSLPGLGKGVNRGHSTAASADLNTYMIYTQHILEYRALNWSARLKADDCMNVAGPVFGVLATVGTRLCACRAGGRLC